MLIGPLPPARVEDAVELWRLTGLARPWNDSRDDLRRALDGPASAVLAGVDADTLVATAMVGHDGHRGWVYYLAVRPALQARGHGRAMMGACEAWLAERGVPKLNLMVRADNAGVRGFYAALGFGVDQVVVLSRRLGEQSRERTVRSRRGRVTRQPELRGTRVALVPVGREHVPELRRILVTPEVRSRWRDEAASPGWPLDDPSATRFAVIADGEVQGMVQYGEEVEPDYRHASIDIFIDPAAHGCGLGRDAVATLARHLVRDRGHHRLVIDPAADNEPAIRCYAAVGFRPVGIMRRYERDADGRGWHDGLLMDLLAEELDR